MNVTRNYQTTIDDTRLFNILFATEIYSLMRDSELSDTEYLDRFHDDGHERCLD